MTCIAARDCNVAGVVILEPHMPSLETRVDLDRFSALEAAGMVRRSVRLHGGWLNRLNS